MAAGSIIIDLLMRTGSFETDTKRAEKRLAELKKEAVQAGQAIGAAFAAVGVAAIAMVKNSIDGMDEMSKQAQKIGDTVENLSALTYAADLAGVSGDALGTAMVRLSKNIAEEAEAFAELGISVKNTDGTLKTASQVLAEVADKIAAMPDGARKTALAVELLGRAGADLIPLLNGGSQGLRDMAEEARALGVVLDSEASKAAEEFNDNLSRMSYAIQGFSNRAAQELLPTLKETSDMLVELAKNETVVEVATAILKTAVGALVTIFQTVVVIGSDVGFVLMTVGRSIGAVAAAAAAAATGNFAQVPAIFRELAEDSRRARAELDRFQARIMSLGNAAPRFSDPRILGPVGSIQEQTRGWGSGGGRQGTSTRNLALARVGRTERPFTTSDRWSEAAAASEAADIFNEAQQAAAAYAKQVSEAEEQQRKMIQGWIDSTPEGKLQLLRNEMQQYTDALRDGLITEEQYLSIVSTRLDLVAQKTEEADSAARDLAMTFSSAFEDAIAEGKGLSDILKGLERDILRIGTRKLITEPLTDWLTGMFGGGASGGSSSSSSGLAGFFGGIGKFFSGFFAEGGYIPAGGFGVAGEKGPELVFGPATVVPPHRMGGGGLVQHNTFLVQGRVDRSTQNQISREQARQMAKSQRFTP